MSLRILNCFDIPTDVSHKADCISWIIETAPKQNPWSPERVIYELMAIWFGSLHILSTTIVYVIHDLCLHPEYVEDLRHEIKNVYAEFEQPGRGLPLIDSFMKESARLSPVESSEFTEDHASYGEDL